MNHEIKFVESTKTGRRYVATEALLKRADMRAVLDDKEVETVVVKQTQPGTDSTTGPTDDNNPETGTGDENSQDDTEQTSDQVDDDLDAGGDAIDLSKFSDEDLLAMAKAEPYKLSVNSRMKRETVEAKLIEAMGG